MNNPISLQRLPWLAGNALAKDMYVMLNKEHG
jgi:hypothetical protein